MLRFATVLLFVCLVFAQDGFTDYVSIDDFSTQTANLVIIIPANPSFPLVATRSVIGDGIFGGERDARLIANSGVSNLILVLGVDGSEFFCSTPEGASGSAMLQYDGVDGSAALIPGGLFGTEFTNDLTRDNVFAFHLVMETDIATTIQVKVYSGSSTDSCSQVVPLPGDDIAHDYYLSFNEFNLQGAGCDFTNVGAIELLVNMFVNVDVIISQFSTYGPVPATPTRSKTPTPTISEVTASPSRTPSTVPTLSPSPSPSPSISPDVCNCVCPTWHCALFRYDDNDNKAAELEGGLVENLVADFVFGLLNLN